MSCPEMPQDAQLSFKIRLAVEEVVVNVVEYAYSDGDGFLEVEVLKDESGLLTVTLKDAGKPFDPLAKEDPDITLAAKDREIGGLGIFLAKQLMDNLSYRYENNTNILTLQKQLNHE